jgi:glucosylceramidase
MQKKHPEVEVNIGTLNTNRLNYVSKFIDELKDQVKAVGLQWEGRQIIESLRQRYPHLHFISTESECGNGSMDWKAGEHTFHLLADYIGKGCDEYFIWNFILCDQGSSAWGWKQNALVQVNSVNRSHRFTPEYYAVKHFSNLVPPGSRMQGYVPREQTQGMPVIVFQRPDKKYVVVAGNQNSEQRLVTVKLGNKYLNMTLSPHSFHSYIAK